MPVLLAALMCVLLQRTLEPEQEAGSGKLPLLLLMNAGAESEPPSCSGYSILRRSKHMSAAEEHGQSETALEEDAPVTR